MANDSLVAETARRIFSDLCDPQTVNRAADDAWMAPAWSALEEAGLPLAWVPEALGGGGAGLADGFAVLREAGRAAVPLPVAETLLAGWLLAQAGIPSPKGAMACGPARDGDKVVLAANGTLSGRLRARAPGQGRRASRRARRARGRRRRGGAGGGGAAQIADGTSLAGDALNAVQLRRRAAGGREGCAARPRRRARSC